MNGHQLFIEKLGAERDRVIFTLRSEESGGTFGTFFLDNTYKNKVENRWQ